MIFEAASLAAPTLDDPGKLQLLEALRQQRRGHTRYPALLVVEPNAAAQQLTNDERHPAFRQYLGGKRNRTELAVSPPFSHAKFRSGAMAAPLQILKLPVHAVEIKLPEYSKRRFGHDTIP
jgi:hypothetical protein